MTLKQELAEPIIDIKELQVRYSLVDFLMKDVKTNNIIESNYKKFQVELKNIIDIEKYHKSLGMSKLQPYQYGRLNNSYKAILKLINISKKEFKEYFDYNILDDYSIQGYNILIF